MNQPSFNLFLTLESVTRLGSFKAAADELLLTPSAVSHRVRTLETMLGWKIFDRVGQGVMPTSQAARFADVVGKARAEIQDAWEDLRVEAGESRVHVSCLGAFGGNYLLPDLTEFNRRFPEFDLRLATGLFKGTANELRHDIIISAGAEPGADWRVEHLMPLEMQAIVAPEPPRPLVVGDTIVGPLLRYVNTAIDWSEIAQLLGLKMAPDNAIITVDSVEAACSAAERGLGIGIAPLQTARRLARSGAILQVGRPFGTGLTYWMAVKRTKAGSPKVAAFRRWLAGRMAVA